MDECTDRCMQFWYWQTAPLLLSLVIYYGGAISHCHYFSINCLGEVLETLNTNQVNNSFACISPCGRFVASAGWFPLIFILPFN